MTTARPPLVTRQQIGDIAIEVDAECGTLARTGDATTIGMMVIAMNRLQAIYEAELAVVITKAEYDALVANQAAPPAMTEEIAETIRSELEAERANLVDYQDNWKKSSSTYKQYAARIAQLDAALAWLSAQKETADGN